MSEHPNDTLFKTLYLGDRVRWRCGVGDPWKLGRITELRKPSKDASGTVVVRPDDPPHLHVIVMVQPSQIVRDIK